MREEEEEESSAVGVAMVVVVAGVGEGVKGCTVSVDGAWSARKTKTRLGDADAASLCRARRSVAWTKGSVLGCEMTARL